MSDDWQNTPTMQAAALEGWSENPAVPMADRLGAAQQANALLRKHIEQLETQRDEVLGLTPEYDALGIELVVRWGLVRDAYGMDS